LARICSLSGNQREGKGLPEHQAMPFLRDVAHDGVLGTFSNIQTGASGVVSQGLWHGLSIYKITPCWQCWVTFLQLARWAAVSGQPSSLRERPLSSIEDKTVPIGYPLFSCTLSTGSCKSSSIPHLEIHFLRNISSTLHAQLLNLFSAHFQIRSSKRIYLCYALLYVLSYAISSVSPLIRNFSHFRKAPMGI
jgi:hypothetical protein